MTAIFIAATGNDVGQTFVTASLIRHLRQMGNQVDAVKPILCGYDPAKAAASNPGILLCCACTLAEDDVDPAPRDPFA